MNSSNEAEVGQILHQRGWRQAFTVAEMANAWSRLVGEVERGYEEQVDEYTNDLSCRNWLHLAWPLLDDQTILNWSARIEELDSRFLAATVDDDGYRLGQFHGVKNPDMWWWRRYPRVLTGDLERTLRSAGSIGTDPATGSTPPPE
ncbi:hypothetical protein EV138_3139 [Kribbella voronezhensis]|uniref:Uncharacterized protein n=1 Tax=Kribbella voronezhensis TaxID=2512212 RepID=A0A4R7TDX0_9ACTN|nr:hypothetical protein [Kribbella voronezhensis]TDU89567.1 hypothetical protein EV138_3139 [Kribbella voronezhensis]